MSATVASHRAPVARDVRDAPAPLGWAVRLVGAVLSFGVYWIHVKDQGGFPGDKDGYMRVGWYALEVAAVLVAIALMAAHGRTLRYAWRLAVAVALAPMVSYLLTRGPGLPGNTDDKGNWTQPLGVLSLAVEGVLLILAVLMVRRATSPARPD